MKSQKFALTILMTLTLIGVAVPQNIQTVRGANQAILGVIKSDIEANYLGRESVPKTLAVNYKKALDLIGQSSLQAEMSRIIGLFLLEFDDPRIFLSPQSKNIQYDYQWDLDLVGNVVYVKNIDPKSDAYEKGLRAGDRVYMIEDFTLSRENFWKAIELFEILSPQESLNVLIGKPDGRKFRLEIKAKVHSSNLLVGFTELESRNIKIADETTFEERSKPSFYDQLDGLLICRFPSFLVEPISVEKLSNRSKKSSALIIDLRGVGGISEKAWELGIRVNRENKTYVPRNATRAFQEIAEENLDLDDGDLRTLKLMTANLLRQGMRIGEAKGKKSTEPLMAKSGSGDSFSGKIIVLVDGETSGAAEIFARLVQIEKRGMVLGDITSGRSNGSVFRTHKSGPTFPAPFGLQVPVSEIVLENGDRLDGKGVIPDEIILPTQSDLATQRDRVLARAAEILGVRLTAEEAGLIFAKKR